MEIKLERIEDNDMVYIYEWFKDIEFLKFYDYMPPIPQSADEVNKTFGDYKKNEESDVFAIKLFDRNLIIGIAGFDDIVNENKVATLFIGIGNKYVRGRGYGKEALKLLLEYGFNKLGFHRIQLNVLEFNTAAISLYEKAGFKREGTYREFVLRDDKRYDLLLYGLLKSEWK
ncbi:GNAT family N-acetyltransferase [Sedimentibacter hydroxybenzoicus DSM 7310]|uniref:GNAT family N-acetyltransferase n=1 Tax=Sedimentibacter hydroxybenzoicus DSM 7310 TaxID=1123245 RepID=A0A974BMA2_SEDHY|nr:GNAT family protein [Sedimentibacter hydroxybenzoicus]NYB75436.1 GNAT family N-acetyltransferase [Sedimentibacter hydroxybenzoicus DSM 7310]